MLEKQTSDTRGTKCCLDKAKKCDSKTGGSKDIRDLNESSVAGILQSKGNFKGTFCVGQNIQQ